ncbi:hypothetical protein [Paraburkholderia fungorum]|nr:hypothetical protein [Paraburkholderia fungorum]
MKKSLPELAVITASGVDLRRNNVIPRDVIETGFNAHESREEYESRE